MQHSRVGLAKFLFRNISLLIKVCKYSQFKVKVIIFTAVLKFISVELSQISQFLTVGFYLGSLQVYNLNGRGVLLNGLQICNLNNSGRVLVRILVYRGIAVYILDYRGIIVYSVVRNLRVEYILVSKVDSKAAQVCKINLVKQVRYKARDPIKFKGGKKVISFNII